MTDYQRGLLRAVEICDEQIKQMEWRLPNAFGGNFAKKFAANALRGTAALIRQEATSEQSPTS